MGFIIECNIHPQITHQSVEIDSLFGGGGWVVGRLPHLVQHTSTHTLTLGYRYINANHALVSAPQALSTVTNKTLLHKRPLKQTLLKLIFL